MRASSAPAPIGQLDPIYRIPGMKNRGGSTDDLLPYSRSHCWSDRPPARNRRRKLRWFLQPSPLRQRYSKRNDTCSGKRNGKRKGKRNGIRNSKRNGKSNGIRNGKRPVRTNGSTSEEARKHKFLVFGSKAPKKSHQRLPEPRTEESNSENDPGKRDGHVKKQQKAATCPPTTGNPTGSARRKSSLSKIKHFFSSIRRDSVAALDQDRAAPLVGRNSEQGPPILFYKPSLEPLARDGLLRFGAAPSDAASRRQSSPHSGSGDKVKGKEQDDPWEEDQSTADQPCSSTFWRDVDYRSRPCTVVSRERLKRDEKIYRSVASAASSVDPVS